MKHSTGNTLISSNHPGTFAIYSFASNALVILSDGHTCDGTFNVDMWTTWTSKPWIMLSRSVREVAVAIYGFLSLSNTHIRHQKQTRPRIQPQSPPTGSILRNTLTGTTNSHFRICVRHLQTIFIHKLMFRVEEEKAQFCTLFVIFICHLCNYTCWTCWIR